MTYKPIPEHRRRELATLVPELTRKFETWNSPAPRQEETEYDFWNRELRSVRASGPAEIVWLLRHVNAAVGRIDPGLIQDFRWPRRCSETGPRAHREGWPLEPIPDEPQAQPTPEGPIVDGTPVKEGDVLYYVGANSTLFDRALVAGPLPMGSVKPEDSVWFPELKGWLLIGVLSRTKPVIIEGHVVKPGDVLYYKPTTPNPDIVGQERVVHKIVCQALWFVNGATCGSPENMTYVRPEKVRVPKAEPLLGAPYGPSVAIAAQRAREMLGTPHVMDCDAARSLKDQYMTAFRDLDFSRVEKRIAPQMEAYRLAFDLEPVKLETFAFNPAVLSTSGIETHRFINPAVPTHSKEKHTMNQATSVAQATPFNHASLSVDTSKIVEIKTFVYGTDIAALNDDDLLNHVERLTAAIDHLEDINERTPLAKLVTKIAQLKDAKAKIVDLLGGAPVQVDSDGGTKGNPSVEAQPRRRRTKAEMEADAQQGGTTPSAQSKPVPPAPPAPTQPEPSVADVDLDD